MKLSYISEALYSTHRLYLFGSGPGFLGFDRTTGVHCRRIGALVSFWQHLPILDQEEEHFEFLVLP